MTQTRKRIIAPQPAQRDRGGPRSRERQIQDENKRSLPRKASCMYTSQAGGFNFPSTSRRRAASKRGASIIKNREGSEGRRQRAAGGAAGSMHISAFGEVLGGRASIGPLVVALRIKLLNLEVSRLLGTTACYIATRVGRECLPPPTNTVKDSHSAAAPRSENLSD